MQPKHVFINTKQKKKKTIKERCGSFFATLRQPVFAFIFWNAIFEVNEFLCKINLNAFTRFFFVFCVWVIWNQDATVVWIMQNILMDRYFSLSCNWKFYWFSSIDQLCDTTCINIMNFMSIFITAYQLSTLVSINVFKYRHKLSHAYQQLPWLIFPRACTLYNEQHECSYY